MSNTRCGIFATCCRCHRERPINELIDEANVDDDEGDASPDSYYCFDAFLPSSVCSMTFRAERDERQRKEQFNQTLDVGDKAI